MGTCGSNVQEQTVTLAGPLPPTKLKEKRVTFQDTNTTPRRANNKAPLGITSLQVWPLENGKQHRTKRFTLAKTGTLVVRRGQPFKLTLTFNRPYNSIKDELKFFFETGEKPKPGNDTMVCLSSFKAAGSSGWKADFLPEVDDEEESLRADLWVYTPPTCIVGDWTFSMQSILHTDNKTDVADHSHPDKIFILFNPWCQGDPTFLPSESLLEEYVNNPNGVILQGSRREVVLKPWVYGQFEPGVLEASIHIMKQGFDCNTSPAMADPVILVRNLTKILNAEDDNGVLLGRWFTNNFRGGRSPTGWSGSVAILKTYVDSAIKYGKPTPVKFGQCFVFSGIMVTLCRALGIPCRSVTNFNSGRDNDGTLAIDFNYDMTKNGLERITSSSRDFVWNFHVWNDVWMSRRDLKAPYNTAGWQAVDATPQVVSDNGVHCCGPAPLAAIKDGAFTSQYDVGFIYSEVNADVIHWLKLGDSWAVFKVEESRVGQCVLTKRPDGQAITSKRVFSKSELDSLCEDVTDQYKHPEGSKLEREVARKANREKRPAHPSSAQDVDFKIGEIAGVNVGDLFNVSVTVKSHSTEPRTLKIYMFCETVFYNGKRDSIIKQINFNETIEPGANTSFTLEISQEDYIGKLIEHSFMKAYVLARVVETGQIEAAIDDIVIRKPNLVLEPVGPLVKDQSFELKVIFENPLSRPLTKCLVSVEGTGVYNVERITKINDIPARCIWTGLITLLPLRSKILQVSATLHCKELLDLKGSIALTVAKSVEESQQPRRGV